MEQVNHKTFGIGTVVKREIYTNGKFTEVETGGNYITVRFRDNSEKRFSIPVSFEKGVITALGSLNDEVVKAVEENEKKRDEDKIKLGITDGTGITVQPSVRKTKKSQKITLTGDLRKDYQTYLETAKYADTVVNSYCRAIEIVCREERVSFKELLQNIMSFIVMYDEGGIKEELGNYQHKTVINALRRYRDFLGNNPDALK